MSSHLPFRRRLLVEGAKDLRIIPYLMEGNGVLWPDKKKDAPVEIREEGGSRLLPFLESTDFQFELAEPSLFALGVILDADTSAGDTWQRLRRRCSDFISEPPITMPTTGFIAETNTGKRFGIWVMPDNASTGMMETFLKYLVPTECGDSWAFAEQQTLEAKGHGATYRDVHRDKANIHSWLAWQDEPGQQLHDAVKQRILRPDSPYAQPFVNWFRELFGV